MNSNCLFFAIKLHHRRCLKGKEGYLIMRKSRWGFFPHFLYGRNVAGKLKVVSFIPHDPKHKMIPPPFFKGRIKWGDA